ncbi:hypothetical protein DBR43_27545 [Pedobacter sp. KBW06]|uniref:hypothetical protein n=1 Tax=Pedobacter sp. KBW06 TaxID=2153359 RepID=UPI000F5A6D9B|nr:hypothetical protein [Pedobacter sp. KBW06]RQO66000.1 hypothetical protein DBR43_27545 [Pedobacter sp. KBW06]
MSKFIVEIPNEMTTVINGCAASLGGVGAFSGMIGAGTDLGIIGPVWVGMTISLANKAGSDLSEQALQKIAIAVFTGAGSFIAGAKIASAGLGWIAAVFTGGLSLAASAAANAALNVAFTRSYGRAVARFFLAKEPISSTEIVVKMLIALLGADYGIKTSHDHLLC